MKHSYLGNLFSSFWFSFTFFVGITVHCIDKNNTLQRVFLGLKELKGSHTAYLLRTKSEELLEEYGLAIKYLYKIVTDSGSNILCAFKDILQVEFSFDEETEVEEEEGSDHELDDEAISNEEPMEVMIRLLLQIFLFFSSS